MNAWNEPASAFERNLLPQELFELFLTNTEMDRICVEKTNYTRWKGTHMFTITVEKHKAFLTILLVGGYAGYTKKRDVLGKTRRLP